MNKKALILLSILLITLITGLGFLRWENVKKAEMEKQAVLQQQQAEEAKRQEEKKQAIQTNNVDTSNWKIYKSDEYGFEFKYPKELSLSLINKSMILRKDCSGLKKEDLAIQMRCDLESSMSFGITTKTINQIVEDYKNDCQDGHCFVFISSQEDYQLDGVPGKKLIGTNAEGLGALNYIYVTNNNKNYIISFIQLDDVYSKVLSTFEFIK